MGMECVGGARGLSAGRRAGGSALAHRLRTMPAAHIAPSDT